MSPSRTSLPTLIILPLLCLATTCSPLTPNASLPTANPPTFIPPPSLPTTYPHSLTPQNPSLTTQIANTLAHYPLAIDGKNFPALNLVFTPNVIANYSAPLGVLTGLPSVISTLEKSLAPVRTQHAFSTQVIEIGEGEGEARSVTYFTASHFGVGGEGGMVLYTYGQYQDDWIKICCPDIWRIKARTLVYMGPYIGNISVFT